MGRGQFVLTGMIKIVKCNILRQFRHMKRMGDGEFTKGVHMSEVEGSGMRGRSLVNWENRVEYMRERGRDVWIKQGGSVGTGRAGGPSAVASPLWGVPIGNEVSELYIDHLDSP